MRNLFIILNEEELHPTMEKFFIDSEESGNIITFGMRMVQEDLPEYSPETHIRGYECPDENVIDHEYIQRAIGMGNHGQSDRSVIHCIHLLQQIEADNKKSQELGPSSIQVEHFKVNF